MIKAHVIAVLICGTLVVGCGSTKETPTKTKGKTAVSTAPTVSQADYPYIEQFHQAVRKKTVGDYDGAINGFQACLQMRQDDDAVYYALGQIFQEKGNMTQALDNMYKASNADPKNIWYTEEIAYMLYENQRFEEAVPQFKKLVAYEEKNLTWLYGYGDCLLRTGKTSESIEVLNKAEDIMGINPGLSVEKFNLLISLRRERDAFVEMDKARKAFPDDPQLIATLVDYYFSKGENEKAIGFLQELSEKDPENGRVHLALGEVYRKQEKKQQSYAAYTKAFQSPDVDIDTKMKVLIDIQQASFVIDQEAMALAVLMVEQYPADAKSYSILGDYLITNGNDVEGLKAYRQALALDKKIYPIWNQVMIMEYQSGNWKQLYEDTKECLNYYTTIPTVYLLHGIGAIQMKQYDEAIESLEIGKALVTDNIAIEAEFMGQLGEAYYASNNHPEGKKWYQKAIQKDPESNLLKNNFAYHLATVKKELPLARSIIEQAIKRSPNNSNYLDTRGWISFQEGNYTDALKDFQAANQLDPEQEAIIEHMGDANSKLGNTDKAVELWIKAEQMGATNKNLSKKIQTRTYHEPLFD